MLFVTARQCLSCRGIGYVIRQLMRNPATSKLWVVSPASDVPEVCEFLTAEKAVLPVWGAADVAFTEDSVGGTMLFGLLAARDGALVGVASGQDADDLLPRVAALLGANHESGGRP